MWSDEWEGFYIDKGCHFFNHNQNKLADFQLQLCGKDVLPITVKYGSITLDDINDEFAIPVYKNIPRSEKNQLLGHLSQTLSQKKK